MREQRLVWSRDGFRLFYKRLERGTFQSPNCTSGQAGIDLSHEQLMLILQDIDPRSIKCAKPAGEGVIIADLAISHLCFKIAFCGFEIKSFVYVPATWALDAFAVIL